MSTGFFSFILPLSKHSPEGNSRYKKALKLPSPKKMTEKEVEEDEVTFLHDIPEEETEPGTAGTAYFAGNTMDMIKGSQLP